MIKKFIGGVLVMMIFLFPVFVFAQDATGRNVQIASGDIKNPLKDDFNTFPKFIAKVTKTAVDILIPFIVLAFVYSGFLFIKAQGNPETLKEAKSALWWSVVGAFILLGAYAFATIIGDTINTITSP